MLDNANWSLIPKHCREGLRRYLEEGVESGDFLRHVICNDLKNAVGRADGINRKALSDYVIFLHNYAPSGSWGSPEAWRSWSARGGLNGISKAAANPELAPAA